MSRFNDVREQVIEILSEVLNLNSNAIRDEDSIRGDLAATSLEIVTLSLAFEDTFGGVIEENELLELVTVQDIINYVQRKLQEGTFGAT